jgi:UPF0176 protein
MRPPPRAASPDFSRFSAARHLLEAHHHPQGLPLTYIIHTFYQFFDFPAYREWKAPLLACMEREAIRGTILLAAEGLNATVSGSESALAQLHTMLATLPGIAPLTVKTSTHDTLPFGRAKVKLKKELISLGEPAHPARQVGTYVPPEQWNELLQQPDVVVIDARNSYEAYLGSFRGAVDPQTRKFTQLPAFTRTHYDPRHQRRVASFCTGGIRCEKYTAWLLEQGFEEVYHLEGGILNYLEKVPAEQSLWEGSCYVFDERIAVGHGLVPDTSITACPACGHPLTPADRTHPDYRAGESCPHCPHYPPSNA